MAYQPYQPTWNNPYLQQQGALQQQNPFQNPFQTQNPFQQQSVQPPTNELVQVNGPQSAMQYSMPPNSVSRPLIDSSSDLDKMEGVFYIVTTDGTGTKSLKTADFGPHKETQLELPINQTVTREEYDQLVQRVGQLEKEQHVSDKPTPSANRPRKAKADDGEL